MYYAFYQKQINEIQLIASSHISTKHTLYCIPWMAHCHDRSSSNYEHASHKLAAVDASQSLKIAALTRDSIEMNYEWDEMRGTYALFLWAAMHILLQNADMEPGAHVRIP